MTVLSAPPPQHLPPAPQRQAVQRLVMASGTRRRTEIVLGAHHLEIDGRCVALDDIEAVAYSTRRGHANLVQRRIRRRVWIGTRHGPLQVEVGQRRFGRQDCDREAAIIGALVRVLHERVEPRLRSRRVEHLRRGGTVAIGPVTLTPSGLAVDGCDPGSMWPWRSMPLAELRGDHVALVDGGRDGHVHGRIDTDVPDAVMLPELLWSASAALI